MRGLNGLRLTEKEKRLVSNAIRVFAYDRSIALPNGKKFLLSTPENVTIMNLINAFGEKRTEHILGRIALRADTLRRLDNKFRQQNNNLSDMFSNVAASLGHMNSRFNLYFRTEPREKYLSQLIITTQQNIEAMKTALRLLEESQLKDKQIAIDDLRRNIAMAEEEARIFEEKYSGI